jgi:DAK2 domain fusion protein YloV
MSITSVNGKLLKEMVTNGAINLRNAFEEINQLNVFPVPDGDTGTNMSMTMTSGITEMNNCESSSIVDQAKVLSRGLLMGARGNSGVILSQFFRGIYVGLKNLEKNELSIQDFIKCLVSGKEVAYKAVMEPVEGTILTVIREAAECVVEKEASIDTFEKLFDLYVEAATKAWDKTPELLPVLKEAGVKDSGGAGFLKVVEGMRLALYGEMLSSEEEKKETSKYEYLVNVLAKLNNIETFDKQSDLRQPLSLLGDSIKIDVDGEELHVSIMTNKPGFVISQVLKVAQIKTSEVSNDKVEISHETEQKELALISVCFGDGIKTTFKELGVDYIIDGGQTMNPPTEEFVKAIKNLNAKNVIIIPNNGNVILSAEQTTKLCDNVNIKVLKAKTLAQGYASLMVYDPTASIDQNFEEMTNAIANVKSGEVTYAVRDTEIKSVKITAGDFMGILNGEIVVSVKDRVEACKKLLESSIDSDSAVLTIFVGKEGSLDEASVFENYAQELNEDIEVEVIEGKQDIYSYILSVE